MRWNRQKSASALQLSRQQSRSWASHVMTYRRLPMAIMRRTTITVHTFGSRKTPEMPTETVFSSRMSGRQHGERFAAAELTFMRSGSSWIKPTLQVTKAGFENRRRTDPPTETVLSSL